MTGIVLCIIALITLKSKFFFYYKILLLVTVIFEIVIDAIIIVKYPYILFKLVSFVIGQIGFYCLSNNIEVLLKKTYYVLNELFQ